MKEFKIEQKVRIIDVAETHETGLTSFIGTEFIVKKLQEDGKVAREALDADDPWLWNISPLCCELVEETILHSDLVAALAKHGQDILSSLTPEDCHLLHMAVGIAGEAGELLDAVKKAVIYRKPIDRENVIEELGDLEFYMEGIRQGLGITREETVQANIAKLSVRYGEKYSDKAAQERADKVTL